MFSFPIISRDDTLFKKISSKNKTLMKFMSNQESDTENG